MGAVLPLAPALDAGAAAPLRDALLERRGVALGLDGSNVERIGGLCLQVLLSAAEAWAFDRTSFGIVNASEALLQGLERMGASDLLMWRDREHAP